MKKKKIFISITVLIIGISGFYGFKSYAKKVKDKHCFTTKISSRIFDFNTFEIEVDSTLNLSDFKVVNQNSGKVIFSNSKNQKGIKNKYGRCSFELFWKEKLIYEFGHFKFNNWHTNNYKLVVERKNNELNLSMEVFGPDYEKDNMFFRKVRE
jgi:hypothetical protein